MASQSPSGYRRALQVLIALQCVLVLAFVYHGLSAPGPFGPRVPAVQGDTLWLQSHGELHQFNAQGQRLQHVPLADLKLSGSLSSLQFTSADVFWAHHDSHVHRCELKPRRCLPVELADLDTRRSNRWVRVSSDESEITVSDASRHRVLTYRRDAVTGRYNLVRTDAEGMRFPNQTLQVGDAMWVANTNRHQIVQLHAGQGSPTARQEHAIAHADLRPGRTFPFAMAQDPRGQLWVLVARPDMQQADLLIMNERLQPDRVIPLGPLQDPNAIVLFQGQMLLTDMTQFLVRSVDLYGRVLSPFGDAGFQADLETAHNQSRWSRRLPTLLASAVGVLMLIGVWLAWKTGELGQLRGSAWRTPAPDPVAPGGGATPAGHAAASQEGNAPAIERGRITMLKALPGSTRTRRRVMLVTDAIVLLTMGAFLYWVWPQFYQRDCAPGKSCALWIPYAFAAMAFLPVALSISVRRKLKALEAIRIGTDGEQVQARVGNRRYHAPADQVTCTRQQLLIGLAAVPLRLNGQALFDEEALRRDFIDRLPQMQVSDSPWRQGRWLHYWKNGGWAGRAIVLGTVALCGAWAWFMLR